MEKERIYFGHPINFYNTKEEADLIELINKRFPQFVVENPSKPCHGEGYKKWKKEKDNGMAYFFEEVLPKMSAGIFLPFEDGMFGAGVFGEAKFLYEAGKPIYGITLEGKISRMILDDSRALSVEETRRRVYPDY